MRQSCYQSSGWVTTLDMTFGVSPQKAEEADAPRAAEFPWGISRAESPPGSPGKVPSGSAPLLQAHCCMFCEAVAHRIKQIDGSLNKRTTIKKKKKNKTRAQYHLHYAYL